VASGPGVKRVLSAVVFLPIFWVIVKKLGTGPYEALIVAAAVVGLFELFRLARACGHRCHRVPGLLLALLTLATFVTPRVRLEHALLFGVCALPLASLWRDTEWSKAFGDVGATLFAALFVGVLFGFLIGLRHLTDPPKGDENGSDLVFLLFFVVWSSDVAAYYVGHALGRRPLAPRVSPKKTVEGAIGGLLGALGAAFVARAWFIRSLRPLDCVVLGLMLAAVGILGDLVESMFKRGAGAKDSAHLVPGHGGLLDRVDSLLFSAPVLYYYYLFAMRPL
jgi:phosphatidate cytidylyltransferase